MLPPLFSILSLAVAVLFGLYMLYEVRRWTAGNRGELAKSQFVRRVVGGGLLEMALVMWVVNPLMESRPPAERLLYLLTSTLFALLAMMVMVREAGVVMRDYHRSRRELFQRMGGREHPDGP